MELLFEFNFFCENWQEHVKFQKKYTFKFLNIVDSVKLGLDLSFYDK